MASKTDQLNNLKKTMQDDPNLPLRQNATQLVFGEGDPDSKIYFLGEAPGFHEDRLGRPFVGQAGKLLDQLVQSIGLARDQVYISNIVRFRPPENRDPLPKEIEAFRPYVDQEIAIINPDIIVTLGRFSMNKFLPDTKISQIHGRIFDKTINDKQIKILPMYHPAAALRAGNVMEMLKNDFQKIKQVLDSLNNSAATSDPLKDDPSAETPTSDTDQLSLL